jgi:hypothetical protein
MKITLTTGYKTFFFEVKVGQNMFECLPLASFLDKAYTCEARAYLSGAPHKVPCLSTVRDKEKSSSLFWSTVNDKE